MWFVKFYVACVGNSDVELYLNALGALLSQTESTTKHFFIGKKHWPNLNMKNHEAPSLPRPLKQMKAKRWREYLVRTRQAMHQ
jgi:hypothetical protein